MLCITRARCPTTRVFSPCPIPSLYGAQRGVKEKMITRKANLLPLRFNDNGSVRPAEKILGYGPDEVARYNSWLARKSIQVAQSLGASSGGRFTEIMEKEIQAYIETDWGIKMSIYKAEARRRRNLRVKARKDRLLEKRLEDWNKLEDIKENRILRDLQRENRKGQFSWANFLRAEREKKRVPYVIEDEETFQKRLELDQQTYLFNGPKAVFKKRRGPRSYEAQLHIDVLEPWLYELRRKGRIAELVEEREDAIARAKWVAQNEERKAKRLEERKDNFMRQLDHWNATMGRWHKENNELRMAKVEYMKQREDVLSKAAEEFLTALQDEHELWEATPSECRFLRFRFVEGTTFPYNKTNYI